MGRRCNRMGGDVDAEFQRWDRSRGWGETPPTKQAIPQIRRGRRGRSREMKAIQGTGRPLLSMGEWDCLSEDIKCAEYKNDATQVVWVWMFQKKLIGDNSRNNRGGRMKTLRKQNYKSSRYIIKELTANNSTIQAVISKTKEEVSFLSDENRTLEGSIDPPLGGSSAERRESWLRQRPPVLISRKDNTETTTDEEGANDERRLRKKRVWNEDASDMEKRSKGKIRFGREQRMGQGNEAITPLPRYHVLRRDIKLTSLGALQGVTKKSNIRERESASWMGEDELLRRQHHYDVFGFLRSQFQTQWETICAQESMGELGINFCFLLYV